MVEKLPRLTSGVAGLDAVLGGGFVEGASYIIQGSPGAGKTILSNQIAFAQAANNRRILYVTLLAETHDRLFQCLSTLSFFNRACLGEAIRYVSVFQTLRDEGLNAVVRLLREETQRHGATLLVFDGLLNARDRADTDLDVKTFVAELQSQAAFVGCTVLFLTSTRIQDSSPEHTMVDGVIDLSDELAGARTHRRLQVKKSRGSAALGGFHQFEITSQGMAVFPRLEALLAQPSAAEKPDTTRLPSGVSGLDHQIGGGLPAGSVTFVSGPPGSGKTLLGLSFLTPVNEEQPGLFFGFYETPARLLLKAAALGLNTQEQVAAGHLDIVWHPLTENILDKLAHTLLGHIAARGVKRLVIDGIGGFERAAISTARLVEFFASLTNELRARGVTTMLSTESRELSGKHALSPLPDISAILDNFFLLSQEQTEADSKRIISILKMRDSLFSGNCHVFDLAHGGIQIVADGQRGQNGSGDLTASSRG